MAMNAVYRGPRDLPEVIPLFPLSGALLLPRAQLPLNIFEPRYLLMIDDVFKAGHRIVGVIQPRKDEDGNANPCWRPRAVWGALPSSPKPEMDAMS